MCSPIYICLRVQNVACSRRSVEWREFKSGELCQYAVNLFQCVLAATSDIKDLARNHACGSRTCQQVRGNNVVDVGKIPALLATPVNRWLPTLEHLQDEFRQHAAVRRIGALARPKNVVVAQAHGFQSIHLPIAAHVVFAGKLLHRIGRNRHGPH